MHATPTHAWTLLAAGVIAWDIAVPTIDDTLTAATHRAINRHPTLTRLAIATVALHLAGLLPVKLDPIHRAAQILRHGRP